MSKWTKALCFFFYHYHDCGPKTLFLSFDIMVCVVVAASGIVRHACDEGNESEARFPSLQEGQVCQLLCVHDKLTVCNGLFA